MRLHYSHLLSCAGVLTLWAPVAVAAEPAEELPATAQETSWTGPTYALDWRMEVAMILIPGLMATGWALQDEQPPPHCAPLCDRHKVNAVDRYAAGNWDEGWSLASDVTVAGTAVIGIGALFIEEGFGAALNDLVVIGESMLWTNGWAVLANMAARRPRPFMYGESAPLGEREDPNGGLSFISGHVGVAAAVTTSLWSTFRRRDPDGALQWWTLGTGAVLTTVVGLGRVQGGHHFPTDVTFGALLGATMGLIVPYLHESPVQVAPSASARSAGVAATMSF